MKKKIFVSIMAVVLAFSAVGCGKGKKDSTPEDPNAAVRDEIVTFVNEDLPGIDGTRSEAVAIYNAYFTLEEPDNDKFLTDLNDSAITKMDEYITALNGIATETEQVATLKNLYLQGVQKQRDAMSKVAEAISTENPDILTEADSLIAESNSYFTQYESQLKIYAVDYNITINGSFTDGSTTDIPADSNGSITPVE